MDASNVVRYLVWKVYQLRVPLEVLSDAVLPVIAGKAPPKQSNLLQ